MPILKWKDEYSVGVSRMDDEHKVLIDMINRAYDSIAAMREDEELPLIVAGMRDYAMKHFATEERLMQEHGYPLAERHKKEHNDFLIKAVVNDTQLAYKDKKPDPLPLFTYLTSWLNDHILWTDKELGRFLAEKGVG